MSEPTARILIAVDCSDESMELVRYVSESARPAHSDIMLYTVLSKIPEVFWDIGKDPLWQPKVEAARKWEKKHMDHAMEFMGKAVQLLKKADFRPANVHTKISPQREGIARDIVAEARQNHDVLVIGRGKSGSVQDQVLGSVASKIVTTRTAHALWLVAGTAHPAKILVAMDQSDSALKVVRHAGKMLNGNKPSITLFHAIRGIAAVSPPEMVEIFPHSYQQQLLDDAEREMLPVLLKSEALLNELDISPERITSKVVTGVRSRAKAVSDEAQTGGYGTIVVGRRGVSEVADFSMGRVTNKLIQLAKDQTLCIVD